MIDDITGESIHTDLGMFVLVITGHGVENCVLGVDNVRVRLPDLYSLLSPKNFPAMKGKPKVIILQACAGGGCCRIFTCRVTLVRLTNVSKQG